MKYVYWFITCLLLFAVRVGAASMTLSSLTGAVTATETSSFKTFMAGETPPAAQTYDNTIADGTAGMEAEALGLMYEVTNDPSLLNQMIVYADDFLSLRNDFTDKRVMWTGKVDPVWLTKAATSSEAGYAGCENNDIVGHIAYCAKLILQTPSLWNVAVPDGNPHGYGVTYYSRATNYISQMEYSESNYFNKYFVSNATLPAYRITAPTSSAWTAIGESVNAWNRQMMFLNGWQRLSECHQLLGDNPANVAQYDAIVSAAMTWFISGLQSYTTNGVPVYNWTYAPGSGGTEDNTLHSTYDIWGVTRAWASGRYAISNATMIPLANTLQYVMNVSTNAISYYVNGTSSPNSTRNFIYPGWMPIADFNPATYAIMANMNISQGSQHSTAIFDAFILWVKNARWIGTYPTNAGAADYTLSTPWTQTVAGGSNSVTSVTVNALSGFTNTVTFSASHLPKGVTANFNPATITNGSGTITLTLTATNTTEGGIYALTNGVLISGTSSLGTRVATIALVVKSRPVIVGANLVGSNFIVSGTNGLAGSTFYVLNSTNAALALNRWATVATNGFNTNGNFSVTNPVSSGTVGGFYLIQY